MKVPHEEELNAPRVTSPFTLKTRGQLTRRRCLGYAGDKDRAQGMGLRALAIDPDDVWTQYNVACVYANLGDIEQALDVLERVLPHAGHELKHGWIKHDSDLDPLRSHPRYQKILELIEPTSEF